MAGVAIVPYPDLKWIKGFLKAENRLTESISSHIAEADLSEESTLPIAQRVFLSKYIGLETIAYAFHAQKQYQVWGEYDWLEAQDWTTILITDESDTIEIQIDSEATEFDLSLLDEKEREFFQNFVGAFDPGPNFKESDLKIDNIY